MYPTQFTPTASNWRKTVIMDDDSAHADRLAYLQALIDEIEDQIAKQIEEDVPLEPIVQSSNGLNTAVLKELFHNGYNMVQIAEAYGVSHDSVRKFASNNGVNRFDKIDGEIRVAIVEYIRENVDRNVGYHEWQRILIREFGINCGVHTVGKMLREADPLGISSHSIHFQQKRTGVFVSHVCILIQYFLINSRHAS